MTKPVVIQLGGLPDELSRRLSPDFTLLRLADLPPGPQPDYAVAVTMAVTGADATTLDRLTGLKLIASNGAGLDQFDLDDCARRGIEIAHTPDAVLTDTADYAIALIFATRRQLLAADRFVRSGDWKKGRFPPTERVTGCKVGIIGLGRIGSAVAQRAAALNMQVSYLDPFAPPGLPYAKAASAVELSGQVDVLIATCPGGEATHHIINESVLTALGENGILINQSRGTVVDEAALLSALRARKIRMAALDVFESEPNIDPGFAELDNVLLSPHAAAVTHGTRRDMANTIHERLTRFFAQG